MIEIKDLLNNQLFQGGMVLTLFGGLLAYSKTFILNSLNSLWRSLFYTIEFSENLKLYPQLTEFITNQKSIFKFRNYAYVESENGDFISPASGNRLCIINKKLVLFSVRKEKKENGYLIDLGDRSSSLDLHYVNIKIFLGGKKSGEKIINKIINKDDEAGVNIYVDRYGNFTFFERRRLSLNHNLVFNNDVLNTMKKDIQEFLDSEKWYLDNNINYKRGYLLYGPPGNGKTSAIMHLASYFSKDIIYLKKGSMSELYNLVAGKSLSNKILIMEDFDRFFENEDDNWKSGGETESNVQIVKSKMSTTIEIANLLNWLDGMLTKHGTVLIATTNHLEKIDPVILRSGRFDVKLNVGNATKDEISRLFFNYYKDNYLLSKEFITKLSFYKNEILSKSDIQEIYIRNKQYDLTKLLENVKEMYINKNKKGSKK